MIFMCDVMCGVQHAWEVACRFSEPTETGEIWQMTTKVSCREV